MQEAVLAKAGDYFLLFEKNRITHHAPSANHWTRAYIRTDLRLNMKLLMTVWVTNSKNVNKRDTWIYFWHRNTTSCQIPYIKWIAWNIVGIIKRIIDQALFTTSRDNGMFCSCDDFSVGSHSIWLMLTIRHYKYPYTCQTWRNKLKFYWIIKINVYKIKFQIT